jgi:hypothetical protein
MMENYALPPHFQWFCGDSKSASLRLSRKRSSYSVMECLLATRQGARFVAITGSALDSRARAPIIATDATAVLAV